MSQQLHSPVLCLGLGPNTQTIARIALHMLSQLLLLQFRIACFNISPVSLVRGAALCALKLVHTQVRIHLHHGPSDLACVRLPPAILVGCVHKPILYLRHLHDIHRRRVLARGRNGGLRQQFRLLLVLARRYRLGLKVISAQSLLDRKSLCVKSRTDIIIRRSLALDTTTMRAAIVLGLVPAIQYWEFSPGLLISVLSRRQQAIRIGFDLLIKVTYVRRSLVQRLSPVVRRSQVGSSSQSSGKVLILVARVIE